MYLITVWLHIEMILQVKSGYWKQPINIVRAPPAPGRKLRGVSEICTKFTDVVMYGGTINTIDVYPLKNFFEIDMIFQYSIFIPSTQVYLHTSTEKDSKELKISNWKKKHKI